LCERLVWRSADRVFVVTTALKDIVAAAGVDPARIIVTPNGVDLNDFPCKSYRARVGEAVTIGFIGFVREWHGLDSVIAGLARSQGEPPIRLIIVGDGPALSALERQATQLGVSHLIEFSGIQPRARVRELIERFDIALQPRAVSYASPLKIFEYMACGRAIVAPNQPNIREILDDGDTAILFDPEDPEALWHAIRALAANPQQRERLGRAAREALERRDYTWQGNAARIKAELVGAAAGRCGAAALVRPPDRFARRE
jgi:glycosyltransferase involved in cell wall biosynthesis